MDFVNLRKIGQGWEFESEADLEDFVWANLKQLLGLTPLKRQHYVNGQYCDILAVGENKQLVVLELKNGEDRYIVQQLTRYYDALRDNKPFSEEVDYDKPIDLIAITPNFHRDNFTDRKYNPLSLHFLQFEILEDGEKLYLQLKDIDDGKFCSLKIPYDKRDITKNIASPPKALLNRLAKCDKSSDNEREAVLKVREKILGFDSRMQEVVKGNSIEYGRGKSKLCAEFYFSNAFLALQGRPNLFLRLPEPEPYYRQTTLRMHIKIEKDWATFSGMTHYPRAFVSNKIRSNNIYRYPTFIGTIQRCADEKVIDNQSRICYQNYEKLIKSGTNSLELLVEIALETWLKRL